MERDLDRPRDAHFRSPVYRAGPQQLPERHDRRRAEDGDPAVAAAVQRPRKHRIDPRSHVRHQELGVAH